MKIERAKLHLVCQTTIRLADILAAYARMYLHHLFLLEVLHTFWMAVEFALGVARIAIGHCGP